MALCLFASLAGGIGLSGWACVVVGRGRKNKQTRGVSHCGLTIYKKKSILRQKQKSGNSNISPCKNIVFKKIL
jgi:hypothetical protein